MTLQLVKVRKFKSVKKNVHDYNATFSIITNVPHNKISHIFIEYYTILYTSYTRTIHLIHTYYTYNMHTIHILYT